jgi:hypothetical protein
LTNAVSSDKVGKKQNAAFIYNFSSFTSSSIFAEIFFLHYFAIHVGDGMNGVDLYLFGYGDG